MLRVGMGLNGINSLRIGVKAGIRGETFPNGGWEWWWGEKAG